MKTTNRKKPTIFFVALLLALIIPASIVFAADPVTIESSAAARNYFDFLNTSGSWVDVDRRDHWVVETGATAYCMNAGTDSPHDWNSFGNGETIVSYYGDNVVSRGIEIIFYYGYPSTAPSTNGLTTRQARYATAMAISCWLAENGYPQGSNFYNLANGWLRSDGTAEGDAVWTYFMSLITLARAQAPISHSVSVTPQEDTYYDAGDYVRSYRITLNNCNSGYTINAATLPTGYTLTGYTGVSGDIVTVRIPAAGNAGINYSFTAIGWDNRTAGNLIVQEPASATVQPMMYQLLTPLGGARDDGNIEGEDIDIELDKLDGLTGDPLAGVEFTVWTDAAQTTVFATAITDAAGVATVVDLPEGTYYWAETGPIPGYVPDSTLMSFTITGATATGTFELENDPIEVILSKIDADTGDGLPGAHFVIRNDLDVIVAEGDTTATGEAFFLRIPAGDYTFSETIAPSGYVISNDVLHFSVAIDGTVSGETTMENTRQQIELVLYKDKQAAEWIEASTDFDFSNVPAAGIEFDVFAAADIVDVHGNIIVPSGTLVDTITTNASGIARTDADLYYGSYYAIESDVTSDVVPDYVSTYPITLTQLDQTTTLAEFELNDGVPIVNDLIQAYMQIYKVASDTTLPLEGVSFEVYDLSGNLIDSLVTDSTGHATTRLLPCGGYTLIETETVTGYALAEEQDFSIYLAPSAGTPATQEMTVLNEREARIEVYKVSEEWQVPLSGVTFGVYTDAGVLLQTLVTDAAGAASCTLPEGDYYLQEIEALPGYQLDPTQYDVDAAWAGVYRYNLENQMTQLVVSKRSSTGPYLEGMGFTITDSTGVLMPLTWNTSIGAYLLSSDPATSENTIGRTGADGTATILGLLPGSYTVTEVDAPDGFQLDSEPITVSVTAVAGVSASVTLINTPTISKTGETGTRWISEMILGFCLVLAAVVMIFVLIIRRLEKPEIKEKPSK